MMHLKGIYQHDSRDCGVACLATICGFYGLKVPLSVIWRLEKTDMNGLRSSYRVGNADLHKCSMGVYFRIYRLREHCISY